jgi:hypothetical protein
MKSMNMNTLIYLLSSAALIFATTAYAEESDKEWVARNMAAAVPPCTATGQNQLKLSANAAKSMCTCAYKRLFSENSITELRRQEKARDREATNKLMQPIMLSCYQAEIIK